MNKILNTTLIIILLIIFFSGCIYDKNNEDENKIKHIMYFDISLNNANDGYILFPEIVDNNNEILLDIEDYRILEGKCEIEKININNTKYINISCESSKVIIEVKKEKIDAVIDNVTFSGVKNGSTELYSYVEVFYSGKNNVYIRPIIELYQSSHSVRAVHLGPTYLKNGWNEVPYYVEFWAD